MQKEQPQQRTDTTGDAERSKFFASAPQISLPKGGGAVRGIGEKFAANPVTGTGSMSVPIATSPGRAGFGPQLSLSYDSGAGNGPFGLGWSLSLPSITRKTDKGLPRYDDAYESDLFLLAGAEDLVPQLAAQGDGSGITPGARFVEPVVVAGVNYTVRRYRPRIEGLFARIERWTENQKPANTFWRTISRDNVTTWYGKSDESRVFDPDDPARIFQWLICETHDDKGNAATYHYKREDPDEIPTASLEESNRTAAQCRANCYIDYISYGNTKPCLPRLDPSEQPWIAAEAVPNQDWMFRVVFDYTDPALVAVPTPSQDISKWLVRADPFSTHRAGFEVRTYRLCRRVLMFHRFATELGVPDYLVRSTDFLYRQPGDPKDPGQTGYTVLASITQRAYQKSSPSAATFESRELPPVQFTYSQPQVDPSVHAIDAEQLKHLPVGTQGPGYRWVDLDGEGLSGVLAEQGGGWYYKPNRGDGQFGPMRQIGQLPASASGADSRYQFMDLAGDGEVDVVDFGGATPGFYEREGDQGWKRHVPFASLPNIDWQDPNLRFIDLTGDGHADALITEHEVFTWYPSLEERGFAASKRSYQHRSEDDGPRVVFADGLQSIFLADMCGDGLTDLVRIRNGEICYWPNLGYGRFGRKVTLGNSPRFDHPDLFDPSRIRLTDIDGSGPIDVIYLSRDGARLYFNRSGNSLSDALTVALPVATENLGAVQVADLLGNGTACLVWNSHLPADTSRPVRYIDLMAGLRLTEDAKQAHRKHEKPHLLIKVDNNLGATTEIEYTPSTRFYLQDLKAGSPWITRLPFPVHCVSKVTVVDKWRGTRFSNTYSYHHGYFDGIEREFRGFGRVEQVDIEDFGKFAEGNMASPWVTDDTTLYQPPVKTVTWYHTGAAVDRQRILNQFAKEYFPQRYASRLPNLASDSTAFHERTLPEPELPADLEAGEWREALRACKGMVLRQEVYELDIDALTGSSPKHIPVRLFSAATHNCRIQRLQPKGEPNRHAVFLVTESEALTYHYELAIPNDASPLKPDPRIAHILNLRHDEYGNPQQSVAVGYTRWQHGDFSALPRPELIRAVQAEEHLAYTEIRYTEDVILPKRTNSSKAATRHRRLRLPCETRTYELKGISRQSGRRYFEPADFSKLDLSDYYGHRAGETPPSDTVFFKQYHEQADGGVAQKRLVEHTRTLYFNDASDTAPPDNEHPLPFGQHGPRGLKYQDYKLALTDALLAAVFGKATRGDPLADKLAWPLESGVTPRSLLSVSAKSGYVPGTAIGMPSDQYWMRSGTAGFASKANERFFLAESFTDSFGNKTELTYDIHDLFITRSADAKGNVTGLAEYEAADGTRKPRFDYRVLAPLEMVDANGNHSEVMFDILGLPVAAAVKGKKTAPGSGKWQGDDLSDFDFALCNPLPQEVQDFCVKPVMNATTARRWLGRATTRFVYHFGGVVGAWGRNMPGTCGIARERHQSQIDLDSEPDVEMKHLIQVSLECSDGSGNVLMKKIQAEPEPGGADLRWIVNGLTVLNNKGKPVKQYEPYFSEQGFGCEIPSAKGQTPITYYDAAGRTVRTEMPDGTFSRVEFSPWYVKTFDANDTAFDPEQTAPKHSDWYLRRTDPTHPRYAGFNSTENQRAAELVKVHSNTPALTLLDSLGRDVVPIAHNRIEDANGTLTISGRKWRDERHLTFTKLDAEGKPLWIRDALGHFVMQYIIPPRANNAAGEEIPNTAVPCYDIAGNLLFQHSMDAGDKWTLNNAAGKPMFAWDVYKANNTAAEQKRLYSTDYDALHRPTALKLKINNTPSVVIEKFDYQDAQSNPANNLNGQLIRHYDASGLLEQVAMDFKGSLLEVHRALLLDKTSTVTDWQGDTATLAQKLSNEIFSEITEYDALNRMTKQFNWHRAGKPVAVYIPTYGERGVLKSERLVVGANKTNTADGFSGGTNNKAIEGIRYDAKGQRQYLQLGNGTITHYEYDPETFRLRQLRTTRLKGAEIDPGFPGFSSNLADARVVQQLFYTYDPIGNITEIQDQAYKPVFFANAIIEPITLYEYDALYRLTWTKGRESAQGGEAGRTGSEAAIANGFPITDQTLRVYQQKYHYDAVGNFLTMQHIVPADTASGWTRRYLYAFDDPQQPASNRLWRTWQGSNTWDGGTATNKVTYAYDSHGSMLNLANVPADFTMQWDHRDMIASISLGAGGFAHYQYDAGKQRTRKTITRNNVLIVEERIYLGGLELYRRVDNGVLKEEIETLHLFDGERRLLMVDQILETGDALGKRTLYRYTLSNHLGSSTVELDDKAEIISYEEYHPYGTSAYRAGRNAAEVKLKRYRYTGMERDEESGLSYHTARYYLPWLGRWGSCDPKAPLSGLNLYRAFSSNPLTFIDRTGTEDTKIEPKILISGGEVHVEGFKTEISVRNTENSQSRTVTFSPREGSSFSGSASFETLWQKDEDGFTFRGARNSITTEGDLRKIQLPFAVRTNEFLQKQKQGKIVRFELNIVEVTSNTELRQGKAFNETWPGKHVFSVAKASGLEVSQYGFSFSRDDGTLQTKVSGRYKEASLKPPPPQQNVTFAAPRPKTSPSTTNTAPVTPRVKHSDSDLASGEYIATLAPGAVEGMTTSRAVGLVAARLGASRLMAAGLAGAKAPGPAMLGGIVGAPAGYGFEGAARERGLGKAASIGVGVAGAMAVGAVVAATAVFVILGATAAAPVILAAALVGGLSAGFGYLTARSMHN